MEEKKKDSPIVDGGGVSSRLRYLDTFLIENDLDIERATGRKYHDIEEMLEHDDKADIEDLCRRLENYLKLDRGIILDPERELPPYEKLSIDGRLRKIRQLREYLLKNHDLELYRALSVSEKRLNEVLEGRRRITKRLLSRLSAYFSLPVHFLTNDEEELPLEKIRLDENLLSIQKEDVTNEMAREANRRSFRRNYNVLSHRSRLRLFLTSALVVIPLVGYTAYCAYTLIEDRVSMSEEFIKEQTLTEEEQDVIERQDALLRKKGLEKYQVDVGIGMSVASIGGVSNSGMSFSPTLEVFFDFDNEDYYRMIYNHENNLDFDERNTYLEDPAYIRDDFGYNSVTGEFFKHADNVPDYMQLEGYAVDDPTNPYHSVSYKDFVDTLYTDTLDGMPHMPDSTWDALHVEMFELSQIYSKVIAQYPGETTTNVYPEKEGIFSIGHSSGSFVSDEFTYGISMPYVLTDQDGNKQYRYFQSATFTATIKKVYDSPRYPLDSVSFTIPITAEKLSYEYLRYVPVDYVDLTAEQTVRNADPNVEGTYTCSIEQNVYATGTAPGFKIGTAYKLFSSGDIKPISKKCVLTYFVEPSGDSEEVNETIKDPDSTFFYSEYRFIMHANRGGISLFLQAFINLFAVVIWISIAFYDQSYHGESAIGMLGTGLFGAISSILVGLSMISEAGIFSLITMINVFTLAVILVMTVSSINAKRSKIVGDKALVAYNAVRMKILFWTLTICTLVMFVGLPFASFIFY